jgi:hypothetical protein
MDALLAFAGALVSLRLAAELIRRRHRSRSPSAARVWAASLLAFSLGSAALAWGAAAGWDDRSFRAYYLFGGLLTAALLGAGSLALAGWRHAVPVALVYVGLAVGIALAMPIVPPVGGSSIPEAQAHLELFPARSLAIAGNLLGTLAAVAVAVTGLRRRPVGNAFILAGIATAAAGSALAGLGEAETAVFATAAAVLLYTGFVAPAGLPAIRRRQRPVRERAQPSPERR